MKLYSIFTLFALIIMSSCMDPDMVIETTPETEPETNEWTIPEIIEEVELLGFWKPVKVVRVCSTGSEEVIKLNECRQESRLSFYSDLQYEWSVYSNKGELCEEIHYYDGTWEFGGDYLKYIDKNGNQIGYHTLIARTGDRLWLGDYSSNCYCDGDHKRSHSYTEYIRVRT